MATVSDNFKKWFDALPKKDQVELANYLRGNRVLKINEGLFSGPATIEDFQTRGLFSGPSGSGNSCPTCGKPY